MAKGTNWTCPFCSRPQVLTAGQSDYFIKKLELNFHRFKDEVGLDCWAVACSNPECGEVQLAVTFNSGKMEHTNSGYQYVMKSQIDNFRLRPSHYAKFQPEFIPLALRDNYLDACKIRDLSPKGKCDVSKALPSRDDPRFLWHFEKDLISGNRGTPFTSKKREGSPKAFPRSLLKQSITFVQLGTSALIWKRILT